MDDTIRPSYLVFDDTHMYYIDGKVIKKRHVETGETEVIFEGVYDNRHLCLQDDWLYFYTKGKGIIKVKTDGTRMEVVRDVQAKKVFVQGDKLVYMAVQDPWWDSSSLYMLDLVSTEILRIAIQVDRAGFTKHILSYVCPDSGNYHTYLYDVDSAKKIDPSSRHQRMIPIRYKNSTYLYNGLFLYDHDVPLNQCIEITDHNDRIKSLFNNYIVVINKNDHYIGLYDVTTGHRYYGVDYEGFVLDIASHGERLYVASIVYSEEDDVVEKIHVREFIIQNGMFHQITAFDINNNQAYYGVEPLYIKLEDLMIDQLWEEPFALWTDDAYDKTYEGKAYNLNWSNGRSAIYQSNADSSKETILCDNVYGSEEFHFFFFFDMLYYFDDILPILRSYNLKTRKTKEYGELPAYPIKVMQRGQYLIFDSYYNGYCYVRTEDMIYKGQRHALNMETGEIIQLEPEYPR